MEVHQPYKKRYEVDLQEAFEGVVMAMVSESEGVDLGLGVWDLWCGAIGGGIEGLIVRV